MSDTEILYDGCKTFIVLGDEMNLISDQTEYGQQTIAHMDGRLYYLGEDPPTLESAMFAWQELKGRELTLDELDKVLSDNETALDAINGE